MLSHRVRASSKYCLYTRELSTIDTKISMAPLERNSTSSSSFYTYSNSISRGLLCSRKFVGSGKNHQIELALTEGTMDCYY